MEATLVNDTKKQLEVIMNLALSNETDHDKVSKELGLKVSENGIVYIPYTQVIR